MLRSIQIKIVMIFMILGILIIGSLGFFFVYNLNVIDETMMIDTMTVQDVKVLVENQMNYTKNVIFISLAIFTIIIFILRCFCCKGNYRTNFTFNKKRGNDYKRRRSR